MNTIFGRISRAVLFIITFSVLYVSTGSARDVGGTKPKTSIDGITDSLQAALRDLNTILRRLDTEWSAEWKHALKESKEARDRAKIASGADYDSAMADLNRAMHEMETAFNAPGGASVRNSLHLMDSEMKLLNQAYPNFQLDSMSFGPYHTPKIKIPKFTIPDADINIPEINFPEIDIPEIDEEGTIGNSELNFLLDSSTLGKGGMELAFNGLKKWGDGLGILGSDPDGYGFTNSYDLNNLFRSDDDVFGPKPGIFGPDIAGKPSAQQGNGPRVTRDYYSDGHTQYFIKNPLITEPQTLSGTVEIWPKH